MDTWQFPSAYLEVINIIITFKVLIFLKIIFIFLKIYLQVRPCLGGSIDSRSRRFLMVPFTCLALQCTWHLNNFLLVTLKRSLLTEREQGWSLVLHCLQIFSYVHRLHCFWRPSTILKQRNTNNPCLVLSLANLSWGRKGIFRKTYQTE